MGNVRSSPSFMAVSKVLRDRQVPYTIEHGGKHPRFVFQVRGRRQVVPFTLARSNWRTARNAAAAVRRLVPQQVETRPAA